MGAGPSGLAVAACLERARVPYVLLEAKDTVGSSWRGHYERLHLHTVKALSSLPYVPFPKAYPRYVPRAAFVEYLDAYARRFGLSPRFGQAVKRARFVEGRWTVETESESFAAEKLVVATGYNRRPVIPSFPGQDTFAGTILHSSAYKTGAAYRGRRVLVVGMGNSGAEIALDLVEQGAVEPALSVRSPTHVVPRDVNGLPAQWTGLALSKLPRFAKDAMGVWISKQTFGDLEALGIRRPSWGPFSQIVDRGRIPVIDVGTIAAIRERKLSVMPGVTSFDRGEVVFTGGARKAFDVVVLATGYRAALDEILEGAAEVTTERGYPRAHGVESKIPGLYFIGYRNPPTGQLRDIHHEAKRIAASIAAR